MATLAYCGHVKRKAAEILGVSLKTLYNRLETYNGKEGLGADDKDEAVGSRDGSPERTTVTCRGAARRRTIPTRRLRHSAVADSAAPTSAPASDA